MLEEYLMKRTKDEKKGNLYEIMIHSHLHNCLPSLCVLPNVVYIIRHDTRLVWHSCLWDDIDIDLSFGPLNKGTEKNSEKFSLVRNRYHYVYHTYRLFFNADALSSFWYIISALDGT